jgi:coenzyme F420-0:L-glutamate ligase/coenzyme F420-1:gamma-L-glutamate ligase
VDLAGLIVDAAPSDLSDDHILVIAHKVVSKAEGRVRRLSDVEPGERASELAAAHDRDARLVQIVLDESAELLRAERGVLVCETRHGFVCANAGVDVSNALDDEAVLLPLDPDRSARMLRARIAAALGVRPGVLITDTYGRAWRLGQTDVAIGAAGVAVLDDWRGRADAHGRELRATQIAVGDALAGAAEIARGKDALQPVVVASGLARVVTLDDGPGAAPLRRPRAEDLFR